MSHFVETAFSAGCEERGFLLIFFTLGLVRESASLNRRPHPATENGKGTVNEIIMKGVSVLLISLLSGQSIIGFVHECNWNGHCDCSRKNKTTHSDRRCVDANENSCNGGKMIRK